MLNKISSVLSILSFIISVTTIAAGYAGYRYITSPQFEAIMMKKVMKGVNNIRNNFWSGVYGVFIHEKSSF